VSSSAQADTSQPINWRPLGEALVEDGLISADQLEETLSEQAETSQRLGEILVARGLVSPPDLRRALVDQLERELERERPAEPAPVAAPEMPAASEPAAPVPAPVPPLPEAASTQTTDEDDPRILVRQVTAREAELLEKLEALEARLVALEGTLAEERTAHRRTSEELERGRREAGRHAAEVRSSLARIQSELSSVDAAMAWFEYWSKGAQSSPCTTSGEQPPQP
jgi:hypothetical protein